MTKPSIQYVVPEMVRLADVPAGEIVLDSDDAPVMVLAGIDPEMSGNVCLVSLGTGNFFEVHGDECYKKPSKVVITITE